MSQALLLALGAVSAVGAANARWPLQARHVIIPSWFLAFLVTELAVHLLVMGAAGIALLVAFGDPLGGWAGWLGLGLWAFAAVLAIPFGASTLRTRIDVDGRPEDLDLEGAPRLPWWLYAFPALFTVRPGVRLERGRVYGRVGRLDLKLDIVRPKVDPGRPLPAVIHVHGGVWMFGSRKEQGRPLMNHLAANGWVGFNIDYRLSPRATMPEHVEDVKRAIAWVREHAAELGVDPDFIALTGGSAGGHLTALAALSFGDESLQPGFEHADTRVQAAVPFYGIYELATRPEDFASALSDLVEEKVVKAKLEEDPERFIRISPSRRLRPDAPPFFVLHGTGDTIVPVNESRTFVRELRAVSDAPVLYAELPGGQHSFDSIPSWRSGPAIRAIERFLAATYATRHLSHDDTEDAAEQALTS